MCAPCSPYRWPLPTIDPDKPARVCTSCYAGLAGGGEAPPSTPQSTGSSGIMSNLGRRLSVGLKDVATRIRNSSLGGTSTADEGGVPHDAKAGVTPPAHGQLQDDYVPDRRRSVPRRKPSATPADGYTDIDAAVEGGYTRQQPPPLPPRNQGPPTIPERPTAHAKSSKSTLPPVPTRPAVSVEVEPSSWNRRRSSSVHRADFDRVAFEPVTKAAVTPKARQLPATPATAASSSTPGKAAAAPAPAPVPAVAAAAAPPVGDTGEIPGAGTNVFLEEHPPVRPTDEASLPTSFLYGCVVAGDFDVEGLPDNWFAAGDEASARVYYFNDVTEETAWAPPAGSDPTLVATTVVRVPKEWAPRRTDDGRLFFVKRVALPRGAAASHGYKSQWSLPVGSTKLRSFETQGGQGGSTETDDVVARVGAIGVVRTRAGATSQATLFHFMCIFLQRIIKDVTGNTSHGDIAGNFAPQRQGVGVQVLGGASSGIGGFDVDYHGDAGTASLLESNTSLEQYKQNKAKREKRLSELHMQVAASGQSAPEAGKTAAPLRSMLTGGGKAPAPAPAPAPAQRSTPPVPPPRPTPQAGTARGGGGDGLMAEELRKLQNLEQSHTAPSGQVNVRAMLGQFGGQRSSRVKRVSGIGSPPQIQLPTHNEAAPTLAKGTAPRAAVQASSGPISSHKRPSWMVARHGGVSGGGSPAPAPAPAPAAASGVASRAKRLSAIASKFGGGGAGADAGAKGPRRSSAVPRIGEGEGGSPKVGGGGTRNASGKRVSALLAKFEARS